MGTRTMFEKMAIGIDNRNNTIFFVREKSIRYANTDPRAIKEINDLRPLQGFATNRLPAGIVMLNPSRNVGIPRKLTISTPVLATSIFIGKDMVPINACWNWEHEYQKYQRKKDYACDLFPKNEQGKADDQEKDGKPGN